MDEPDWVFDEEVEEAIEVNETDDWYETQDALWVRRVKLFLVWVVVLLILLLGVLA